MNNLFPPINESLFLADATKLITTPAWIQWLNSASNGYSIKAYSRDLTAATTTGVAHNGAGFKPNAIVIIGAVKAGINGSVGFSDFTTSAVVYTNASGTWDFDASIVAASYSSGSNAQLLDTLAATADGFTGTWTRYNSPTGTFSYAVLFLR
jgi:hypothetical protein